MIFKTMLSDINKVALAMEGLKDIQITGSINKLNATSLNAFVKGIDGLTLSQAQAALSTRALTDAQKEQILISANLLKTKEALGLEEVKQMASSMSLSAQKKEEILTTLQGAIVENEWNKEKLEAIVASGGEAGAIAQTILSKKAENAENLKGIANRKALTASLWEELKARLAIMASNPVALITGMVVAGVALVALQEKLTKSLDECVEELEEYNSAFESAQSEAESLETELTSCETRLKELQKLADSGTISIIEQEELDRLKETNEELDRNLRIQKEKAQLSAIEGVESADETLSKTVESKYITSLQDFSGVGVATEYASWITPEKELEAAISEYNRLSTEIDKLNESYDNGTISADDYEKQLSDLNTQQTNARTRASEMSDILVESEKAYKNLKNTGGKLTTTQSNNLKTVESANAMYNEFLGTIDGVGDAFEKLDTTEKAQTLKDRYANKTLSLKNGQGTYTVADKEISDWIDTLSDEDLSVLATINFNGEQTKESMEEALEYAKTHTDFGFKTTDLLGISETVDELNTKLKPAMDSLADAYQDIFTEDGFTLDSVSSDMLSSIKESIMELNELEGAEIDIPISDFEEFAKVLTDVNTTKEQADDAFDNFATSIVNGVGATENLSNETAGLVIQLLEEMGIANADEIVMNNLALQKAKASQESKILEETTYAEAVALVNEAGATEITGQALAQLALEKLYVNGQTINTSADIDNVIALANAAGASAEALATLTQAKAILADGNAYGRTQQDWAQDVINKINNGAFEYGFNLDADDFKVDFDGLGKKEAKDAGKEAGKEYKEALQNELDDIEKVISYIGDAFNDQIDALQEAKDNAIDALEEAKDKEIDALEKQKSALEDYKDALEYANKERELAMSLQKAQYELQRMMNQKTALIYKDGQMVYETDTEGIRDKREEIEDIKLDIQLHEIDEQIENIEDEIESVEEKYEKLISDTEKYYDAQIKSLELLQKQIEGITKIAETQEIEELLTKYGVNVDEVLSGNTESLDKLKSKYLEVSNALNEYETTGAMDELATSSDNAASAVNNTADAIGNVATNSQGVNEDINSINTALDTLSGDNKLKGITDAFQTLLDKIDEVASALGTTTEAMESGGGLIGAIQALSEAQIGTELLAQFTELEDAIGAVTSAINGGAEGGKNLTDKGFPSSTGESNTSSSGGLTQAIEEQVNKAKELLPEEISLFGADEESLLSAITKVTTAIAGGDSEGGKDNSSPLKTGLGESEADTSNLMGAMEAQYTLAEEKIPVETSYFSELASAIEACVTQLQAMVELLENMPSATISFGGGASGGASVNGTAHYEGTANVRGNWGVREGGRSLVGELGQEIVVRNGRFFTVGDNGAEFVDLQRGDIVFNHVQTKSLLKNGYVTGRGKSYANGTFSAVRDDVVIKTPTNLPPYLRELQEGDKMYDLIKKMNAHNELIQSQIIPPVNSIQKNFETMTRNISNVNTNNVKPNYVLNGGVNVTCPNVTDAEIAKRVGGEIEKAFFGMSNYANQRASVTR